MCTATVEIAVVTVVRNDPAGLEATLQSLGKQSISPLVTVIDGGSTDNTLDVVRSTAHSLQIQVVSEPDLGPYDAMNKALNLIHSKYVMFMNAGDTFFDSHSLACVAKRISSHNGLWLVGGHAVRDGVGGHHSTQVPFKLTRHDFLVGRRSICHQSVVAKVDALRHLGGFDLKYRVCADFKLMLQLWNQEEPVRLMEPVALYRPGGLSDVSLRDNYRERREIRKELGCSSTALKLKSFLWFRYFLTRRLLGRVLDGLAGLGLAPGNWRRVKSWSTKVKAY